MARVIRLHWYVCCEEDRQVVQYQAPGIFYWRPQIKKTVLRDGEWVDASESAFPGYLFIGSPRGWRHIEDVLPEVQLIRSNGAPHELDERELALVRLFDSVEFNVTAPAMAVGERVRVSGRRHTAFSGLEGTVVQRVPVKGGEQVCVEFRLDQMTFSECVPLDHLEAVRR